MMRKMDELMKPVKNIGKLFGERLRVEPKPCTDEPLMIFSPPGEAWVEVLGHRFEGINGFEGMIEYLNNYRTVEKKLDDLINQRAALIEYLKVRLEEGKLMSTYENGIRYPSAQERIYEDLLERVENEWKL